MNRRHHPQHTAPATPRRSLLREVRSRAHLHVPFRLRGVLDGEYLSVHKGRSLEFDELREYVAGDDVKHIDWNATARRGTPLLKEYVATKQHSVVFVVDTGRGMAGLSDVETTKVDVAVMVTGIIGQLVVRHGDPMAVVVGPCGRGDGAGVAPVDHLPFGYGDAHLERMLRLIADGPDPDGAPSSLDTLLRFCAERLKRRTTLVVISDDVETTESQRQALRRLKVQHDVLFVAIGDVPVASVRREVRMVETGARVPAYLRANSRLDAELADLAVRRRQHTVDTLNRLGIAGTRIAGEAGVTAAVLAFVERHRVRR